MSFNIEVQGGSSVRLPTAGKYCDRDIVVTATGGSDELAKQLIDRTITEIRDDTTATVGSYAFAGCKELTYASFTNCEKIGSYAFTVCTKLVTVNLPKLTDLSLNLVQGCSVLKNISIPEVTNLPSNSIRDCVALEKIDLPKVRTINSQVFLNCSALTAVILRSTSVATLSNSNSFNGTPIANGTGYIYVPAALVDRYKTATNWSAFTNQFRAIEDFPDICGG